MGCGVVVSGQFSQAGYGVAALIRYLDVCVSEYFSDLSYLWGNVCECCPFLVFTVVWCGVFCFVFYLVP